MSEPRTLIVGAGVAGLSCARALMRGGRGARVFERSRGVGGRCATRRIDGQPVDHGAPYLHGTSEAFLAEVRGLALPGLVPAWPARVREPRLACQPDAFAEPSARWAIEGGMSVFPKALASGLDVRLGQRIATVEAASGAMVAIGEDGVRHTAPALVLAGSLAQSMRLLEPLARVWPEAATVLARLHAIEVVPVLTVIAGYAPGSPEPRFEAWNPFESTMLQMVLHDSAKRSSPSRCVLVLHSRPHFARSRMDDSPVDWSRDMVWEAGELLGEWAAAPEWTQAHRWSSGRVRIGDHWDAPLVLRAPEGGTLVLAGDAFGGRPGVEGAWRSGVLAARALLGSDAERLPR